MTDRKSLTQFHPSRRQMLAGAAALGVAGGFAGGFGTKLLSSTAYAAEPKKGGHVRWGSFNGATTDTLDPALYTDIFMLSVGFATHSTLTEISPEGELVGDAAESFEGADGGAKWTFKLRPEVTFSDGKKLTADDVIASINHHLGEDSKSAAKSILAPIKEMKKDGDSVVVFELSEGSADFPYLLADYHLLMMPSVEGKANWQDYIGSGGYTMEHFEPGVRVDLKRRDDYWKPNRAFFDSAELTPIIDPSARTSALATGAVDVIDRVEPRTVSRLARLSGVTIDEVTGFLHYTTPMITTEAPYNNNDLRLALKYATDRSELVDKILYGHGTMGNDNPIAPSVPFWADLEQREYDIDKAKHHLQKAGYNGETLALHCADAAFAGAVDASVLMQGQMEKAGIKVEVVREPNDGYWSNVWMKKPWSACFWGGRPTCDWMFTTAYAEGANWNDTFWSNERFNKLLVQGRSELNQDTRREIYREMQEIVRDEGGAIVWSFANYIIASNDKLAHGPIAGNWNMDGGRFLERWWMA